jgi:hypothetical protein
MSPIPDLLTQPILFAHTPTRLIVPRIGANQADRRCRAAKEDIDPPKQAIAGSAAAIRGVSG